MTKLILNCVDFLTIQVGVPVRMAKILTYPQKVCPANIELMRKLVMNGPEIHPGANFVELQGSKLKKYLRFGNRPAIAKDLKVSIFISFHYIPNNNFCLLSNFLKIIS